MSKITIPELLSPVGGWSQLKAAVQNGADAVYMGGPLFNARIKADNFTHQDMEEAIAYAHQRNVKVYVTLNTLLKDHELFEAFSYVEALWKMKADAVILQDMGLARLIRRYLPQMTMHLSTQATVYNPWAVDLVKELGFSRIVPARELSLEEIREFSRKCHGGKVPCQVEVFVHGALCICYSGQCQMSRMLGGINGRSGNRGLCAQPCRLPYRDEMGRAGYFLSPKDICLLENIPELCRAGVDSFKIEGRLKSPEYVAVVTSAYRAALDQYRSEGHVKVDSHKMQQLLQIFNRGGFSTGYLKGNPGKQLLSGESPKNQGIYLGSVKKVKAGSTLVDVALTRGASLSVGDGVEIRSKTENGGSPIGNVISYCKELSPGVLRIGDLKGKVRAGDRLYKVTDKALLKQAGRSYQREGKEIPVTMELTAEAGRVAQLNICEQRETGKAKIRAKAYGSEPLGSTDRRIPDERVIQQLSKLGDTPFALTDVQLYLGSDVQLSVSEINYLRRQATENLLKAKEGRKRKGLGAETLEEISRKEKLGTDCLQQHWDPDRPIYYFYSRQGLKAFHLSEKQPVRLCVPLELFMKEDPDQLYDSSVIRGIDDGSVEILPYVLNVSKGSLDRYIDHEFETIVEKTKKTGILLGNLGWIRQFQQAGVPVFGDYGLNVYNSQAVKAFEEIGVSPLAFSHEAEMFFCGNIPLMITEHPVSSRKLIDRKNKNYTILRWYSGDKDLIFPQDLIGAKQAIPQIHYIK